jgi:hypothetical protein
MIVQSFGIFSTHAFLNHERITGVDPSLFVKRSDATAAAIGNHNFCRPYLDAAMGPALRRG